MFTRFCGGDSPLFHCGSASAMTRSLLCPHAFLSPLEIDAAVTRAPAEDLGRAGGVPATATIPEDTSARAIAVAPGAGGSAVPPPGGPSCAQPLPENANAANTRAGACDLVKIEIEVDTLEQLREVLDVGLADAVVLDNMDAATMRKAVEMVGGRFALEASGGITLDTIAEIAKSGVDYISSGWITHSAPQLDVALDIEM